MTNPGPISPRPGIEHIAADIESGNTVLVAEWEDLARPALEQPAYAPVLTLEQHIEAEQPAAVQRQQAGRPMRSWHKKRLERAAANYQHVVRRITTDNARHHEKWLSGQASTLIELCGLTIIGGNDEAAHQCVEVASERGVDIRQSDKLGLAFLVRGQTERAKAILLGRRKDSIMRSHAHNLFDAYAWTGDPEYRARLLTALPYAKFLVARLANLDIGKNRPIGDLFDVADEASGARLVLSLTAVSSQDTPKRSPFRRYLKERLPGLRAPEHKTITPEPPPPPPPRPTTTQQLQRRVQQDGLLGMAVELPFDALDGAMGMIFGTGEAEARPAPPKPQRSPEYQTFLKNTAYVIARSEPWLLEHSGYINEGYGDVSRFSDKEARAILLAQANAGNDTAAIRLLEGRADADSKYFAYRNLLHGLGSAAVYLPRLSGNNRQAATYYTLVAAAAHGETVPTPTVPDMRDDFGQLQALYGSVAQAAAEQYDDSQPSPSQVMGAELELTDLQLLDRQGVEDVLARIRALNDPIAERTALEQLAARLKITGGS